MELRHFELRREILFDRQAKQDREPAVVRDVCRARKEGGDESVARLRSQARVAATFPCNRQAKGRSLPDPGGKETRHLPLQCQGPARRQVILSAAARPNGGDPRRRGEPCVRAGAAASNFSRHSSHRRRAPPRQPRSRVAGKRRWRAIHHRGAVRKASRESAKSGAANSSKESRS